MKRWGGWLWWFLALALGLPPAARAANNCNLDGVAFAGVYEPSESDFAVLSVEPLNTNPSSLCAGMKCDFDGNGVAVNVGDLAAFLQVVKAKADPLDICLNEGDPKDNPALTLTMLNTDGSTVSNGATKKAQRDGTGLPNVRLAVSDPNGDQSLGTFRVTYLYNTLSFDITSLFSAISGGAASTETGAATSSPFFSTALARYDAASLTRQQTARVGGNVADASPATHTDGSALVMDLSGKRLLRFGSDGAVSTQADLSSLGGGASPQRWLASPTHDRALVAFEGLTDLKVATLAGALVASVPVTGGQRAMAINTATGKGYVLANDLSTIALLDLATGVVSGSATLTGLANFSAFVANQSAATPELYVQDTNNRLHVLDGESLAEKTSFALGQSMNEVVYDAADHRLIYSASDDDPLRAVALADGAALAAATLTPRATSLVVSGGNVFAVSNVDQSLRRFTAATLEQTASATLPSKVSGLVAQNGTLALVLDLLDPPSPGQASAVVQASLSDAQGHTGVAEARLVLSAEAPSGL